MDDLLIQSHAGAVMLESSGGGGGVGGVGGLTGCSHADQHGGEVEGPRCRADEHSDVAAGHGAQTELNA